MNLNSTGLRQRYNGNSNNNSNYSNEESKAAAQIIYDNDDHDDHDQHMMQPQKISNTHDTNHQSARPPSPFSNDTIAGKILTSIYHKIHRTRSPATFAGFFSLLILTMANYMLGPMRDAAALKVGVSYIPLLTLVSTILALASSVPVGWLFEAPNPERKGRSWRGWIGLTRGETQGTSLALFLRCFAVCLFGYAFSFMLIDCFKRKATDIGADADIDAGMDKDKDIFNEIYQIGAFNENETVIEYVIKIASFLLEKSGKAFYVMFFLLVHLMKLHSISLMWGVTSEAMEYEEQAELRAQRKANMNANGDTSVGKKDTEEKESSSSGVRGKSR
jgi:hypothetical protein